MLKAAVFDLDGPLLDTESAADAAVVAWAADLGIRDDDVTGLGIPAPHALMIGDSLEADYLGALAAGMQAVLLDRTGSAGHGVRRVASLHDIDFTG